MDSKIKKLWLDALRSGKYPQTQGYLRSSKRDDRPEGFCCLGVLCDLFQKDTGKGRWQSKDSEEQYGRLFKLSSKDLGSSYDSQDLDCTLNRLITDWAGLKSTDPGFHKVGMKSEIRDCIKEMNTRDRPDQVRVTLAILNDDGSTFEEIANLIEIGL